MPFDAKVLNVMIATPSDVLDERRVIRELVHEWNAIHSEAQRLVLLPIGWESHASPAMGARPQEIVNVQVADRCDLLIAIFWTRLGTPTGEADSGTVEEIKRHTGKGKPAMIYFSDAPVRMDSVDLNQYERVLNFRTECHGHGYVETYASPSEFREKLTRQLAQTIQRYFMDECETEPEGIGNTDPAYGRLSHEAEELLLEASKSDGMILCHRVMEGTFVRANRRDFTADGNARTQAIWTAAVEELQFASLIKDRGYEREIFDLTRDRWELADELRKRISAV